MQFTDICTDALRAMTSELSGERIGVSNFGDALKAFERFKNSGTNAALIKDRIAFDDNRLKEFMAALRKLREYLQAPDDGESSRRNIKIAALRLLDWFAEISKSLPSLVPIAMKSSADLAKNQGFKQIRAAELVIRSLINEKYASQERVLKLIRDLFKNDPVTVSRIEKNAEPGDILSGTEFSQLIALFLRPDEFSKNYHPLYDSTPFLGYLRDKRQTLVLFLDDIRRIRNRIAHHRPLTSSQIELLDLYYDEIIGPIQTAHDEGRIGVNPDSHLEVGDSEINAFVSSLKEDLGDIKDVLSRVSSDIGEIKETLGDVSTGVTEAKGGVQWLQRNAKWVSGGIALLTVIAFTSAGLIERTHQATLDVKKDTSDIKSDTTDIKAGIQNVDGKLANVKQETSSDPRKELVNLGYQWTLEGFDKALEATDLRAIKLFMDGGWNPKSDFSANPDELSAIARMIWSNQEGAASVIDLLLSTNAISPQDRFKMTVYRSIAEKHTSQEALLAVAIYGNNSGLIEYLVKKGYADLNKKLDNIGFPLVFAAGELTTEQGTVETLIHLGARIDADNYKAYQVVSNLMDRCRNSNSPFSGCGPDNALPRNQRVMELVKPPIQIQQDMASKQKHSADTAINECISRVSQKLPFADKTLDEAARFDMFSRSTYTPEDSVKAELLMRIKTSQRISKSDYEKIIRKACSNQ